MNISELSYLEIKELERKINQTLKANTNRFFESIQNNRVQELKDIFKWGLPKEETGFLQLWQTFKIHENISLETLEVLRLGLWETDTLHQGFVGKLFIYFSDIFTDTKKQQIFSQKTEFVDILQWAYIHYTGTFQTRLAEVIHNQWGGFAFNPQKHAELESFVLKTMNRPHKALLRASRAGSRKQLEYFSSQRYTHSLNDENMKESFYTECMGKAIQSANPDAVAFWLAQGVALPKEHKFYTHMITQSLKMTGFNECVDLIMRSGGVEDNLLLRVAFNNNRMEVAERVLLHYQDEMSLNQLLKMFQVKGCQAEKAEMVRKHHAYYSLLLKTEEKSATKRFKI